MNSHSEKKIVYQAGVFYAFRINSKSFEIRKDKRGYGIALGVVPSIERAKRFIDRAVKYPHNFGA
jgi:hypothetical protein